MHNSLPGRWDLRSDDGVVCMMLIQTRPKAEVSNGELQLPVLASTFPVIESFPTQTDLHLIVNSIELHNQQLTECAHLTTTRRSER